MANGFDMSTGGAFGSSGGGGGLNPQALIKLLSGGMGQYQNFIQNPTQSPLYQNQLSGLLAALQPGEERAQTNLMDMFRRAGNMSSGQYGVAGANLQGDLQRNRQTLASQLLSQMFPQMTKALFEPMSLYSSLIQAMNRGQSGSGQSNDPWANIPPSMGLGTPMSGGQSQLVNQGSWNQHYEDVPGF